MKIEKVGVVGPVSRDSASPVAAGGDLRARARGELRDRRVEEAARLYERQFLGEMVRAMRGTVDHSQLTKPSMAENVYRDQLDSNYVESWSENSGIGLTDLIYNELMGKLLGPRRGGNGGAEGAVGPRGPIALTDRDISRVLRISSPSDKQAPLRVELSPDPGGAPAKVQSPWEGRILARTLVEGRSTFLLEHAGGVRSGLVFEGVPSALNPGDKVGAGAPIGILSPEVHSFFWNLSVAPAPTGP